MSENFYSKVTQGVRISVQPSFLADQSSPSDGHFVWAYRVEIENEGREAVQLIARRWLITDGRGMTETVQGPGVVGEQPRLEVGERFTYTSGAPLRTASGFMQGSYQMVWANGTAFDAEIPTFSLDSPFASKSVN
ncbi:MAG: Co2+/Mg2+ efflux protein ApaG [Rhodospirillales bacterium]